MEVVRRLRVAAASASHTHSANRADLCRCFGAGSGQALWTQHCHQVFPVVWLQASISQRHQPSASSLGSVGPLFVWSFGVIFLQRIYLELIGHNTFNPSLSFVSLGRQADDADRIRVCCGLLTQLSVLGQSVFHLTCVDENPPQLSEE